MDKNRFVIDTQALYSAPETAGLSSFTCKVSLDWQTVPASLKEAASDAQRKLGTGGIQLSVPVYDQPKFSLKPAGQSPALNEDPFIRWFSSIVTGFAMTWKTLGLNGPLPFASRIGSVRATSDGYTVQLGSTAAPNGTALRFDKGRVLTEILTRNGSDGVDEHPGFTPSNEGLLFTSSDTLNTQQGVTSHITYNLDYQEIKRFQLPHRVHLKVDDTIDISFDLNECSASESKVVHLSNLPVLDH